MILVTALALLPGCARVMVTTTLHADGSYQRQEKLTMSSLNGSKGFNAYFHFRAEKDGVKYEKALEGDQPKLTITRDGIAGAKEPIDLEVVGENNKPLVSSQVSVGKQADGKILYTERLRWLGDPNVFNLEEYFADQRSIRAALPPAYRSQKTVVALTGASSELMNGLLLGPPKPYIVKAMLNKELAKVELLDAVTAFLEEHKQSWLPGITQEQETQLARSLLDIYVYKDLGKVDKSKPSQTGEMQMLVPLAYVVKAPGKVVQTNGTVSKDGRVYWGLVPLATAKHDIVLSVLCDPG